MSDQIKKQQINSEKWFLELRNQMVGAIEKVDGSKFEEKKWQRPGGGGGLMSVLKGDIFEKDKIILDAKVSGDIKANSVETHSNSNIKGNINSKAASLGGKLKGNVSSDKINIRKTADVDGVLNQQTLSIEEGATLKIKTETYK